MKKSVVVAALLVLLIGLSYAQEPPSWLQLGDLPYCEQVRDLIEIPDTDVLLACGNSYASSNRPELWRSTNGGGSWSGVLDAGGYTMLAQLVRDSATGRIWTARDYAYGAQNDALYYSTDDGASWTGVPGPQSDPPVRGTGALEVCGDYVYFGGSIASPYSIPLFRLHVTDLTWEMVTVYLECNAITRLKYHEGKLLVFARDKNGLQTRVFSYTPE